MNRLPISLTRQIPNPNIYVKMLPEYKNWIYLEEEAPLHKGKWVDVFNETRLPLDLEIGCGNGFFFEHQVRNNLSRNLLGIELKYKPLVQTVRRVKRLNLTNGKGLRFNAQFINLIFEKEELDNVYIYFPDPWPKTRQLKNRLLRREFLNNLFSLQKTDCFVDFKTDSKNYFDFVSDEVKFTPFAVGRYSEDLHKSNFASENFMTSFEKIFSKKNQPIYYMRWVKT